MIYRRFLLVMFFLQIFLLRPCAQEQNLPVETLWSHPPARAKPWVFWYWMHGAVSAEGITADLEAMKSAGIGGAYLMPIGDTSSLYPYVPAVRQLTPAWWQMVAHAMKEAKRLNLQLAMHVSDGFALAGGPWISGRESMQKLVWTKQQVNAQNGPIKLVQPETKENFYKDIAVFGYRTHDIVNDVKPLEITTSNGAPASFLADKANKKESFKTDTAAWIEYQYEEPFTCRSITVHTGGNNFQANRLMVQVSNDGIQFKTIARLEPPRQGWQDADEDVTHSIVPVTAKYFRFVYDKNGTEPGAEDLDAAKWKPSLKLMGLFLSSEAIINQYQSKNGSVWRVSKPANDVQIPKEDCIQKKDILDLTKFLQPDGTLAWQPPSGNWMVVRIGHTSTGYTNATGGAARGLECDKFSEAAITSQFNHWFKQAFAQTDPGLAKEVLKIFHVDSWECGSQNWSENFAIEFKKRRGYDIGSWILTAMGIPIHDAAASEKFLHDMRQTIADLVQDVFYKTLARLAHKQGCSFSAESIAPTMMSDGLLHYKTVDIPMGEFWLNSPTHDKPSDILDAVSGAHIYHKNIIQAEAFTSLRMNWGEHPGNMKTLGDRNFALGANKMVLHVFAHNPWLNRKPGITLDGVGLYFQRDQIWWQQGKAWMDYLTRCQALLQWGTPVADVAVFIGEELPRRSVLPARLVPSLPGIFGEAKLAEEKKRLTNTGNPMRSIPDGVSHSANMADPENWIDPLNGYTYDCFNADALKTATVRNGRVVFAGGASYKILLWPFHMPMQPNEAVISLGTANKLLQLVQQGATILMDSSFQKTIGLHEDEVKLKKVLHTLYHLKNAKGKIIFLPYTAASFEPIAAKDLVVDGAANKIAWCHRKAANADLYFIANQENKEKDVTLLFHVANKLPELWDAVSAQKIETANWQQRNGYTKMNITLPPNGSLFVVFRKNGQHQDNIAQMKPQKNRSI